MIRPAVAVAAALLAAAPAFAAERSYSVGSFDRLALAGSPDVIVTTGGAVAVHATGDADSLDRLEVVVVDGTLRIGPKREGWNWSWHDHGRIRFTVSVPMLHGVAIAGSGDVSVDKVHAKDFSGKISGSGSLMLPVVDVDTADFAISGSGTITAAGRCGVGVGKIAGSGDLKLAGLKCATLSASIAGSGDIHGFATQTATLATMGSGDITLTGGARCTVSTAGSGKAHCS